MKKIEYKTVNELMKEKFPNVRNIETIFEDKEEGYRFNVVTDDISKRSLFGGVATALIFASLLCKKNKWRLRLITRENLCNLKDYYDFMDNMGIDTPDIVEAYSDVNFFNDAFNRKLEITKKDVFFATSWWSAKSILDSKFTNRIVYIIQEVETFFYEYGDTRLLCDEIMHSNQIDFLVNTKLLFDYLKDKQYAEIANNGYYFEPSFSNKVYYADFENKAENREKKKLFFYGRPLNPRNLYYMGVRCLNRAIIEGVIDTDEWDIYFAGKNDSAPFAFDNGYVPIFTNQLGWIEYAEFARNIDVSFSLMYTPHPSYPPFDMVASGAVSITNEFDNKKNLKYSKNMITMPLNEDSLVTGIKLAMELSMNKKKRMKNYEDSKILRNWEVSFGEILEIFTEKIERNSYVCY